MSASNTKQCVADFYGKKLIGALYGELPNGNRGIASKTISLVFDDGTALVLSPGTGNGFISYWAEDRREVTRALRRKKDELESVGAALYEVLTLAGEVGGS